MRELLVVFHGNELVIGVILSCWLACIGLGAAGGRLLLAAGTAPAAAARLLPLLVLPPSFCLPFQVYWARSARLVWDVPAGEYAALGKVVSGSLTLVAPSCLFIGVYFPLACHALSRHRKAGRDVADVSGLYTWEALGSALGGAAVSFLLLPLLSTASLVAAGMAVGLAAAGAACARSLPRLGALTAAILLAAAALLRPAWLEELERAAAVRRWQGFGVLSAELAARGRGPAASLRASRDTIYQNLALTESEGQWAVYGNGQVLFVFPDPIEHEHGIHFVMAQKPDAASVLLLGGSPVGDIPELLKYPLEELVYVTQDPGVGELVRQAVPASWQAAVGDPRVRLVFDDGPRFVRRCGRRFDAVLIRAPEPVTAAANRYFTADFFRAVKAVLAPDGFVFTSVTSSQRLQTEAAALAASVYQALAAVFDRVLVTAETTNRFVAGSRTAGLTFDRRTLYGRSRGAAIETEYFRPEYFLGADEIAPEKTAFTVKRLAEPQLPLNTSLRPVSYFYHLFLWGSYSGSSVPALLGAARAVPARMLSAAAAGGGGLLLFVGLVLRGRGKARHGGAAGTGAWPRLMVALVLAGTGFCGMALEVILIFLFQSLYGYVYARIGLIVAMFMLGLVLGAPSGQRLAARSEGPPWAALAGLETLVLVFCLLLPPAARLVLRPGLPAFLLRGAELSFYLAVALAGWAVGAQFPLGNRLFRDAGGSVGAGAAVTDAADHLGAALGALAVGVLLLPVSGIGGTCLVLASLKLAGLFCLASACVAGVRAPAAPVATRRAARGCISGKRRRCCCRAGTCDRSGG